MKRIVVCSLVLFLAPFAAKAQVGQQITVTPITESETPTKEVIESLIGEGMVIKNMTTNKPAKSRAFGVYKDPEYVMGIGDGVILTSGAIDNVVGGNQMAGMTNTIFEFGGETKSTELSNGEVSNENVQPTNGQIAVGSNGEAILNTNNWFGADRFYFTGKGDADLEKLLGEGGTTYDACVIEMDVVPTADTIAFSYVFASEEYDEFVYSDFNDIFAFFISGPGIEDVQNLAIVPGTSTPVSINNVNNGNPNQPDRAGTNAGFYLKNENIHLEYDGFTRTMEVRQKVIPYQTYHIKMAIADVSDGVLDSGVLIEHKSIISYFDKFKLPFETNGHSLNEETRLVLRDIVKSMKKHDADRLLITGHTDDVGSDAFNFNLAGDRMNAVADYLNELGLSDNQFILQNKGETMPIASNTTESGREQNRRVEIRILGNNEEYIEQQAAQYNTYVEANGTSPRLDQNFPNPVASGNTQIPYFLPKEVKKAQINVFSVEGKLMQNIYLTDRGEGSVVLNVSNYNRGNYIYHMVADDQVVSSLKFQVQ